MKPKKTITLTTDVWHFVAAAVRRYEDEGSMRESSESEALKMAKMRFFVALEDAVVSETPVCSCGDGLFSVPAKHDPNCRVHGAFGV